MVSPSIHGQLEYRYELPLLKNDENRELWEPWVEAFPGEIKAELIY